MHAGELLQKFAAVTTQTHWLHTLTVIHTASCCCIALQRCCCFRGSCVKRDLCRMACPWSPSTAFSRRLAALLSVCYCSACHHQRAPAACLYLAINTLLGNSTALVLAVRVSSFGTATASCASIIESSTAAMYRSAELWHHAGDSAVSACLSRTERTVTSQEAVSTVVYIHSIVLAALSSGQCTYSLS
jgi:hypothetical protein